MIKQQMSDQLQNRTVDMDEEAFSKKETELDILQKKNENTEKYQKVKCWS